MTSKIIAIDGPAGAGKSTVARGLAEQLGFTYLDSGALYRAVTWYLLSGGPKRPPGPSDARALAARQAQTESFISTASDEDLARSLDCLTIRMKDGRISVGDLDVTEIIRDLTVTRLVSMVSERRPVREKLMALQRAFANGNIVVEGRDMGTVVFPGAFLKIYLDANVAIRAGRRYQELGDSGVSTDYDEVYENLRMRDDRDTQRQIAPLSRAPDAVYVDTTYISPDEVVGLIRKLVATRARSLYRRWQNFFYQSTWLFLRALTSAYLRRRASGTDHPDRLSGPVIFASNHMSHLDPILVAVSTRRHLHFLAKRELAEIPIFGQVIHWLHIIPVRRGILDRDALDWVRSVLASGEAVLIFPEGTRSRDGTIHDAKAGFGKLVYESGAPTIPVRIIGSYQSFPPGALWPRPTPVRIQFGEPIQFRNDPNLPRSSDLREVYEYIGRTVMDRIRDLRDPAGPVESP